MGEFRLLGPVEVVSGGRTLALGPPKQRCVLARLLLEPGRLISTEQLYTALWDDPPDTARKAVHVYVSNLRRVLADVPDQRLHTSSGGYRIDIDHRRIDLHVFRELAEHRDSATALDQAIALWRGEALTGLADCPLRQIEGARLTEERLAVTERRATLELRAGNSGTVIPAMYDLVGTHPLRETAYALLMRALTAEGRLGEGLAVYAQVRERLRDELGTEPSPVLTAVYREMLHVEGSTPQSAGTTDRARTAAGTGNPITTDAAYREAPAPTPVPAQLPPQVENLAGRAAQLDQLRDLLEPTQADGVRIAAISGYGGIGKTALAVAAAHAVADRFDDGQLFAGLAGSRATPADPYDVLAGFLWAYGVTGDRIPHHLSDRTALFRSLTAGRRVLLVLDDIRDADQVRPLLPGSAQCAVLVTSRARPAGLDGVRLLPLGELTEDESRTVLARQIGADRVHAEPDAAARIVRHCGGIPLAVRIAAGRLARPSWPLADFAERLAAARHPLDELHDGDLEVRVSFGLSYQRLEPDQARVFRMLAVAGVGRFTLAGAAETLGRDAGELRRVLDELIDLHLVEEPTPGRYHYHDLLHRFAAERSEEQDSPTQRAAAVHRACRHHTALALDALATMVPSLGLSVPPGSRPGFGGFEDAMTWLANEHVTVTDLALQLLDTAADTAVTEVAEELGYLTLVLGNYAEVGGTWPGWEELATRLLRLAEQHGGDCSAQQPTDPNQPAEPTIPESSGTPTNPGKWEKLASRTRYVLAGIAMRRGDPERTATHLEPVLADARRRGDLMAYGRTLAMLGAAQREARRPDDSRHTLRKALHVQRRIGYARGYAGTLVHLADTHNDLGESAAAAGCARATLRIEDTLEEFDPYLQLGAYLALGQARADVGRRDEARAHFRHALELNEVHGSPTLRTQMVDKLADLGDPVDR